MAQEGGQAVCLRGSRLVLAAPTCQDSHSVRCPAASAAGKGPALASAVPRTASVPVRARRAVRGSGADATALCRKRRPRFGRLAAGPRAEIATASAPATARDGPGRPARPRRDQGVAGTPNGLRRQQPQGAAMPEDLMARPLEGTAGSGAVCALPPGARAHPTATSQHARRRGGAPRAMDRARKTGAMSRAARHGRDRHDLRGSPLQCRDGAGSCAIMPAAATP